MPDRVAYKIMSTTEAEQMRREGVFMGSAVDRADGYIHLSCRSQVAATVDKHFVGLSGLMLVAVDLSLLGSAVRWEAARDGQLFPHVYGVLPVAAVISVVPLERAAVGRCLL